MKINFNLFLVTIMDLALIALKIECSGMKIYAILNCYGIMILLNYKGVINGFINLHIHVDYIPVIFCRCLIQ